MEPSVMPKVYRIKHLPTGMYFCPSREIRVKLNDGSPYQQNGCYIKSNLSKEGKTYLRRPTLKQLGSHFYTHLITSVKQLNNHMGKYCMLPVLESEWIIEEIE